MKIWTIMVERLIFWLSATRFWAGFQVILERDAYAYGLREYKAIYVPLDSEMALKLFYREMRMVWEEDKAIYVHRKTVEMITEILNPFLLV